MNNQGNELVDLSLRWKHLVLNYTSNEDKVSELWNELAIKYSGPERHYHTLHHLSKMMQWVDQLEEVIVDLDTMCFSIFYHDVIYDASRKDNEEKSAEFARERLALLGLSSAQIDKCSQQIVSTKAHEVSADQDTNILIDIDLSILGTDQLTYEWYSKAIRKEYEVYPDEIYIPGRIAVLRHFLQKPVIFKTPFVASKLEEQAQCNLETELNTLLLAG